MSHAYPKRRRDLVLLVAVIALALAAQFGLFRGGASAGYAVVIARGAEWARLDLGVNATYEYAYEEERNEIVVRGGIIFVGSANCQGGDCVRQGEISAVGQTIVCLPHKLVIELQGGELAPETDIVVR